MRWYIFKSRYGDLPSHIMEAYRELRVDTVAEYIGRELGSPVDIVRDNNKGRPVVVPGHTLVCQAGPRPTSLYTFMVRK